MNKSLYKIMAGAATLLATACTGDYLNINTQQSVPHDLSADGYALVTSMSNICGAVIPADVNCNQFTDCLLGSTLGGYFTEGANWNTCFSRNNAPSNWSAVFLTDSKIIPTLYANMALVEAYCEKTGEELPKVIAQIIKVAVMNRVTDCYGPIPYSSIGQDGSITNPYDSQEEVYNQFFAQLTEARDFLLANRGLSMNSAVDLVYYGDVDKWIRFANSMKLRLALRISYANPTLAKQMAEDAVNPANGGVIETNDQSATWKNYQVSTNPMRTAIMYNAQDSRPSAEIGCYLTGYNDPRAPKYLVESAWKDDEGNFLESDGVSARYMGIRRGWATFNTQWSVNFAGINLPGNTPALWMNASEVCFLRAEGAAVFGWNMGGTAESFYNRGIQLSFESYGVEGYADYIADDTSVPSKYYDPTGNNPWSGQLDPITIKWDESADKETKQQRIITQKWLANWTLGNEAWADYRRTGYPKLIPVAYNGSPVVDINKGPQRMPYPNTEYTNNNANVMHAIREYLGGEDNQATPLWWACKPGL